jgi:hypothetical protein
MEKFHEILESSICVRTSLLAMIRVYSILTSAKFADFHMSSNFKFGFAKVTAIVYL